MSGGNTTKSLWRCDDPISSPFVPAGISDLHLLVGDDPMTQRLLKVTSHILRTFSPVFQAMLSGPWLEARLTGPIALPEDDPAGFYLLCQILYLCLPSSAFVPPADQLLELIIICDKYDVSEVIVRPQIKEWVAKLEEGKLQADEMVYIAWSMEMRNLFEKSWHRLVDRSYLPKDGDVGEAYVHGDVLWRGAEKKERQRWSLQMELLPKGAEVALRKAIELRLHALHKAVEHCLMLGTMKASCADAHFEALEACNAVIRRYLTEAMRSNGFLSSAESESANQTAPSRGLGASIEEFAVRIINKVACKKRWVRGQCPTEEAWQGVFRAALQRKPPMTKEQESRFKGLLWE